MIEFIERLKYLALICFASLAIFTFWFAEKDFMFIKDLKEIEYSNKELLKNSVGKFVRINNACTIETSLYSVRDSEKKQVFAATNCELENSENTYLFAELNNKKFTSIEKKIERIENGDLLLFEGQLKKINFTKDESYFFESAGINIDKDNGFLLISDRRPSDALKAFYLWVICISTGVAIVSFVFYYFIDRPKKRRLNNNFQ